METAPLIKAHVAARHASSTPLQNAAAASEEHRAAAEGFKAAGDGIDDPEALRILKILEEQHRHIANIISGTTEQAFQPASTTSPSKDEGKQTRDSAKVSAGPPASRSPTPPRTSSPVLQRKPRYDLTSSIANNLATARGIPPERRRGPAPPADLTRSRRPDNLRPNDEVTRRTIDARRASEAVESLEANAKHFTSTTTSAPTAMNVSPLLTREEPFERFYASFGGLLSKLSAPLAFAGLPLTIDDSPQQTKEEGRAKHSKASVLTRVTSQSIPDVSKLFSNAALKAIKEDNPGFGGVQESFMFVPTTGGTAQYSNIHRLDRSVQGQSFDESKNEDFVDAAETLQSRSPKSSRKPLSSIGTTGKTIEELEMENQTLKQLTDNLSRRLYNWEKNAQNSSSALQQSIRNLQTPPQSVVDDGGGQSSDERIRRLEEELKAAKKQIEQHGRENEKLKTVVNRYRERWEKLKEGARVRREVQDKPGDGPGTSPSTLSPA